MLYLQLPVEAGKTIKVAFANGVEAQLLCGKRNKITFKQGITASPRDDKLGHISTCINP
jgi:hypothetical protein